MIDFKEYLTKYRDIIDKEVAGYFYPIDIIMLYGALQRLQQYQVGDVCEIGIAKGKSAICLSDFKKENETLYLFDNFFETDLSNCDRPQITSDMTSNPYYIKNNNQMKLSKDIYSGAREIYFTHYLFTLGINKNILTPYFGHYKPHIWSDYTHYWLIMKRLDYSIEIKINNLLI